MDYLDTILGATIAYLAYRTGKRSKPRHTDPKPVCRGCKHGRSYHTNGTGKCKYSGFDNCTCQAYDGPEPLPEYYA